MSIPSMKTIEERLGATLRHEYGQDIRSQVKQIRQAMEKAIDHKTIDSCMATCNKVLTGYGVETIRDNKSRGYYQDIGLLYVNMGDTYAPTIVYDTDKEKFFVTSWGNIVEAESKRFADE